MPTENCDQSLKPQSYQIPIVTSDVTTFDGNFTCVTLPGSPTLNDTLEALEQAICAIPAPPDNATQINYTGDTVYSCFTITGTEVESVIEELATQICTNATNITNINTAIGDLCTDDIDLCNVTIPDCFTGVYTTVTELLDDMLSKICDNEANGEGLDPGGTGLPSGETGADKPGNADTNDMANISAAFSRFYGTTGGGNLKYYGGVAATSPASLTVTIDDGIGNTTSSKYIVDTYFVYRDQEVINLTASQDHYVDITNDGTYILTSLALGSPAPPVAAGTMRLYKFVTDGVGVTSTTDLAIYDAFDGTTFADDSIKNRHIEDLAVTGDKMEDIIASDSWGSTDFISLSYDTKGRITASSAKKISITALADGDVLMYDLAGDEWINTPLAAATLPVGALNNMLRNDGGSWVPSTHLIDTGINLGINLPNGNPTEHLVISPTSRFGAQMRYPVGFSAAAAAPGSLSGTYYYVVVAYDKNGGKTIASSEVTETVDGVVNKSIVLTWSVSFLSDFYRVYRGTVSGTYTESYDVTLSELTDDGTLVWNADVTPTQTDTSAHGVLITSATVAIGAGLDTSKALNVHTVAENVNYAAYIRNESEYDATAPVDKYGLFAKVTTANVLRPNYGGRFEAENSENLNYGIYSKSDSSSAGTNYGLYIASTNAGAGNAYPIFVNNHFKMDEYGKFSIADGGGALDPNAVALIELQSTTGGFVTSRMTAAQGSALAAIDGLIIYVTDTNGTFTSVGFWGYENSAWVKL
jgi:hypothetical protein